MDLFDNATVIVGITRADAIAAGHLVDVTETAKTVGWAWPVAVTRAVYVDAIEWPEDEPSPAPQEEEGRCRDVVHMAITRVVVSDSRPGRYHFPVCRVPRGAQPVQDEFGDLVIEPEEITLVAVLGPGDDGRPVVTIMQPDES